MEPGTVVVGAALVDDLTRPTRLLAARRTRPPELAGRWELPGGKVEPGEDLMAALHRELAEELGVRVDVGARVGGPWPLGGGAVMHVLVARVTDGVPTPRDGHDALAWLDLTADGVAGPEWVPADVPVVRALLPRRVVLVLPERDAADEVLERVCADGHAARVLREQLAGDDDAEDAQWLVVVEDVAPWAVPAMDDLARAHEGWAEDP